MTDTPQGGPTGLPKPGEEPGTSLPKGAWEAQKGVSGTTQQPGNNPPTTVENK